MPTFALPYAPPRLTAEASAHTKRSPTTVRSAHCIDTNIRIDANDTNSTNTKLALFVSLVCISIFASQQ